MDNKHNYADIAVRLLPMFPMNMLRGGFELQSLLTWRALNQIGVSAKFLNYDDENDKFNVLHLFGASPNYYEIAQYCQSPIVVSAIFGAKKAVALRGLLWRMAAWLPRVLHTPTTYDRIVGLLGRTSAAICLNELEAEFLALTYGFPRSKIWVVPNGVEDRFYDATPRAFLNEYGISEFVLFTGAIIERKNPLRLARVLKRMGLPGIFVGQALPNERAYASEFSEVIASSGKLKWIQGLAHEDPLLPSAYAAARVFCLPSSAETQSLSALEAMAAGRPVILGDLPYAYQDPFRDSLKCQPDKEESIMASIEGSLSDPALYSKPLPDRYRWGNVAEQVADVYFQVRARQERP